MKKNKIRYCLLKKQKMLLTKGMSSVKMDNTHII